MPLPPDTGNHPHHSQHAAMPSNNGQPGQPQPSAPESAAARSSSRGSIGPRQDSYEDQAVVYDFGTTEDGSRLEPPSRACDACKKMKIKCVDKENPPCKRCRHMKLTCRFAVPPVPRAVFEENEATKGRLERLEGHVDGIYRKLDDISSVLTRLAAPPVPRPALSPSQATNAGSNYSASPIGPEEAFRAGHMQPTRSSSSTGTYPYNGPPVGSKMGGPGRDTHQPAMDPGPRPMASSSQPQSLGGTPLRPPSAEEVPTSHPSRHTTERGYSPTATVPPPPEPSTPNMYEDDDDPLQSAMVSEPFRELTRREEELSLLSDRHDPSTIPRTARRPSHIAPRDQFGRLTAVKKRKLSAGIGGPRTAGAEEAEEEWAELPIREKGDPMRHAFDPVAMGHCTEEEARQLFREFFKSAHPFIPIFDPRVDTFERLRRRSPFCITVIIMVALRARESAGPPSELSHICKAEAERMAKATLFEPIATLEMLQGLILLISWGQHAWRISCHAMALAVDMRLYRCLPYLHKIRSESGNPNHLLERQRPLVVGARLWLALMKQSYEMSYNHALPIVFPSPYRMRMAYARELLDHPLSTLYDSRLVVSVELDMTREVAFRPYDSVATLDHAEMDDMLRTANEGINACYDYWLEYYRRSGLPPEHFLVVEVGNQRAYAIMYTNSPAWYGVHKRGDVALLPAERREWISEAVRAAAYLLSSVANKRLEKDSEFGNHNFHVGIVATARYLVRMVELLPEVVDLAQVSLDMDRLLLKLPYYPAQPFTDGLRRTLAKAREAGILPYSSLTDAARATAPMFFSPSETSGSHRSGSGGRGRPHTPKPITADLPGINPFPWNDPVLARPTPRPSISGPAGLAGGPSAAGSGSGLIAGQGNASPRGAALFDQAAGLGFEPVCPAVPPADSVPWPDVDFNLADWFPAPEDNLGVLPVDSSALDADMANWFPAAPQVWLDGGSAP